jgi:hypothetical protein
MTSRQLFNPRALGNRTNEGGAVPTTISTTTASSTKPSASRPSCARQVTDEEQQQQQRYPTPQAMFELPSDSEGEEDDQDNAAAPGYRYMTTHNTPTNTMMEDYESSDDELEPAAAAARLLDHPNSFAAQMAAMRDSGLPCLDPHAAASSTSSAEEPRPAASEDKDWMTTQKELDELFTKQLKERMDDVPKIDMPEILTNNGVKLYKYQKQGVQWLVHKETTHDDLPPFYTERHFGRIWFENTLTKRMQRERPEPIRASILADGKCQMTMRCVFFFCVCVSI